MSRLKNSSRRWLSRLAAPLILTTLVAFGAVASGCATSHQHHQRNHNQRPVAVVKQHPHPTKEGKKPHPHAMWVKGHYAYKAGRYLWVPGHWRR